jgi:hypothetical protein
MDAQLRPALIGGTVMLLALGVAAYAIPTATVPEPSDADEFAPADREYARGIFEQCGGGQPLVVHEHFSAAGLTRFEIHPHGEWKLVTNGGVRVGCLKKNTLDQVKAQLDAAAWHLDEASCANAPIDEDTWWVDGTRKLQLDLCEVSRLDTATEVATSAVSDLEARETAGRVPSFECSPDELACYRANIASVFPKTEFVVTTDGTWQLTQRDVQTDLITARTTGALTKAELDDLRARVDHASWKLVPWTHECADYNSSDATVVARGMTVSWSACEQVRPDPQTQLAVDRLFELYRSALRSQSHI